MKDFVNTIGYVNFSKEINSFQTKFKNVDKLSTEELVKMYLKSNYIQRRLNNKAESNKSMIKFWQSAEDKLILILNKRASRDINMYISLILEVINRNIDSSNYLDAQKEHNYIMLVQSINDLTSVKKAYKKN